MNSTDETRDRQSTLLSLPNASSMAASNRRNCVSATKVDCSAMLSDKSPTRCSRAWPIPGFVTISYLDHKMSVWLLFICALASLLLHLLEHHSSRPQRHAVRRSYQQVLLRACRSQRCNHVATARPALCVACMCLTSIHGYQHPGFLHCSLCMQLLHRSSACAGKSPPGGHMHHKCILQAQHMCSADMAICNAMPAHAHRLRLQ